MKTYCHCGGVVVNGHHCENGHMMLRDNEEHIIGRLDANSRRMARLALEFGYRAAERGLSLSQALTEYDKITPNQ